MVPDQEPYERRGTVLRLAGTGTVLSKRRTLSCKSISPGGWNTRRFEFEHFIVTRSRLCTHTLFEYASSRLGLTAPQCANWAWSRLALLLVVL